MEAFPSNSLSLFIILRKTSWRISSAIPASSTKRKQTLSTKAEFSLQSFDMFKINPSKKVYVRNLYSKCKKRSKKSVVLSFCKQLLTDLQTSVDRFSKFWVMPLLFLIFFALISCSENLFYNESMPQLSMDVAFYRLSDPPQILRTSDTLLAGDTVRLQAKVYPSIAHTINHFWIIASPPDTLDKSARLDFPYELSFEGLYTFAFYAIDNLGDTLSKVVTIAVSSKPVCEDTLSLSIFQGSPSFAWECQSENLSYNFKLINKSETLLDTTLKENFLQWGHALPTDYYEVHLTATNSYGFKYEQKHEWSIDE
jgi:hypothetical protein